MADVQDNGGTVKKESEIMIGEQSMATREEIMDFRERLAVAFERDDAGVVIAVDWVDSDAPDDDPIGTWEDDGGWQEDAYPQEEIR